MTQVAEIDNSAVLYNRLYAEAVARIGQDIWVPGWHRFGENVWLTNITVNMDLTEQKCARKFFFIY